MANCLTDGMSVCVFLFVMTVSPVEMAEQIEMLFAIWIVDLQGFKEPLGPRSATLGGDAA